MGLRKEHIRLSFFLDILFKEKESTSYNLKVKNKYTNTFIYNNTSSKPSNYKKDCYSIVDIPDYLSTTISSISNSLKTIKVPLYNGYLINLYNYKSLNDFLDKTFNQRRKSRLRSLQNRLDLCINPVYKMYYGDILKDEYDYLFVELKSMIEKRFTQKGEQNYELPYLATYHKIMYALILKKKACLFVIYNGEKPINISINFIDGKTIYPYNNSYDINYSIFGLGHINMIKHVEWCFNNNFKLIDIGRGDFLHKRKWVNQQYKYQEYIVYNTNSLPAKLFANYRAFLLKTRYTLIQFLKKTNLHLFFGKLIKLRYKAFQRENTTMKVNIIDDIYKTPLLDKLILIDLYNSKTEFLMESLNSFLYKNQEAISNVKIYSELGNCNIYYFIGKHKNRKITLVK